MVKIVVVTHGNFGKSLIDSSFMIFGKQEKVSSISLNSEDSFETIETKINDELVDDQKVLFLIDLWGGTPFNAASKTIENKDNCYIITGVNLPILLECYSLRNEISSAKDLAIALLSVGRENIRSYPQMKEKAYQSKKQLIMSNLIEYGLARVDSRLLHGQVVTGWCSLIQPDRIIVVSDVIAKDEIRKRIIKQAAPANIKAHVVPIDKMIEIDKDPRFNDVKALLLFENLNEAKMAIEKGLRIKSLNLGSIAQKNSKVSVSKAISLDKEDIECLKYIMQKNISIDIRMVPSDTKEDINEMIKLANERLGE